MKRTAVCILGVTLTGLVSCGKKEAPAPPPPPVTFATAESKSMPFTIATFGNCESIANVTLQAQVTGTLLKYAVAQGAMVKAGDLVAQIDPRPFEAAVQEAQGSLDSAKAQLANAEVTLQRQQALYKTKTIDLADLQTAEANQLQAQGAVLTAEGQLADAKINLGYCTITSPIDGKAGLYLVDAGNLVTANNTQLINVQTINPIYVNFTISENDFDRVRQYFAKGGELPVEVTVPGAVDGGTITGKLTFINNDIASSTGTLTLEATVPNDDARLWPGLFVNVRLILATMENSIVIPSPCVMIGQQGPYVFVVNADNTVTQRNVTLGQRQGDVTVISDGLAAGDRVVTAGQLGLNTGTKVNPSAWKAPLGGGMTKAE
jgi:multidrug efflux system membrane fusion protein